VTRLLAECSRFCNVI